MQINLSSTFSKQASQAPAKSKDSAADGRADSFFEQMGQMLKTDSRSHDSSKAEKSANQSAGSDCSESSGAETGDPALIARPINPEPIYALDTNISDASIALDAEGAVPAIPPACEADDAKGSLLQLLTAEEAETPKDAAQIANPIPVSASSELPMYWNCFSAEAVAATQAADRQNIDGTATPDDIKFSFTDAEGKSIQIGEADIPVAAKSGNIFQEVFADLQSEESRLDLKDTDSAETGVSPDAVESAAEISIAAPNAPMVESVRQTVAPLKPQAAQKGLPVDQAPPADTRQESAIQPEGTVARDPSDSVEQPSLAQSLGISEKITPDAQAVRKQEPATSDASDSANAEASKAAQILSKDETISTAAPQNKSESMLTALLGKSQSAGTERAQEIHTPGISSTVHSTETGNSTRAAGPAAQAQSRQFLQQVADQIQFLIRDGKGEIRIQLKPDALGRIEIKAESTLAGVVARITTETSGVKNYLENNMQALQQTLADQGLRIDRIQIVAQDSFDAQFSSGRNTHFGQAGSGRNGQDSNSFGSAAGSFATGVSDEIALDPAEWLAMNPNNRFYTVA